MRKKLRAILSAVVMGAPLAAHADDQLFPKGETLFAPRNGLTAEERKSFFEGQSLFHQAWVIGPSEDHPEVVGLGPLYNRLSCIACHVKNGRGHAPEAGAPLHSMVVRLSVPGTDEHGAPRPHPVYGGQLNPQGIPGVPGEGRPSFTYETFTLPLGGETVEMRRPKLVIDDLGYGPLGPDTKFSVRNAPPVIGLGLLEQVPESELQEISHENGGRINRVYDLARGRMAAGRFGLKANQPGLEQQNANAFVEDIGITSRLFPLETCSPAQTACTARIGGTRKLELSDRQLNSVTYYLASLAPPPRRNPDDAPVKAGERVFAAIGCGLCHRDTLATSAGESFHPYTDLLLPELGPDLADGREDYAAGPQDWRTAPLWGLGLAGEIGDSRNYLHDGRARSLTEAILWHGGEAETAKRRFQYLAENERAALLAFLSSL
jgi:CxxC motif-containing protein (DUF1111 family)